MIEGTSLLTVGGGQIGPAVYAGSVDIVVELLNGFLDTGYSNAAAVGFTGDAADPIATAWAYYAFYQSKLEEMAAKPSSVTLNDSGAMSWTGPQMAVFKSRADYWLAAYEGVIAAPAGVAATGGFLSIKSLRSK